MVRGRSFFGFHFMQRHAHTALRELPGSLAAGKAGADHSYLHQSSSFSAVFLTADFVLVFFAVVFFAAVFLAAGFFSGASSPSSAACLPVFFVVVFAAVFLAAGFFAAVFLGKN